MMTTIRFFLTLTLALLFTSAFSAASTKALSGAQAVDEAWSKAITANDLDAVMLCYSKDAVMWLPDAPEAKGTEAIRKAYAGLLAANTVTGALLRSRAKQPFPLRQRTAKAEFDRHVETKPRG